MTIITIATVDNRDVKSIEKWIEDHRDQLTAHRVPIPTIEYGKYRSTVKADAIKIIGTWYPISEMISVDDHCPIDRRHLRELALSNRAYCHSCKTTRRSRVMKIMWIDGVVEFWGGSCVKLATYRDLADLCSKLNTKRRKLDYHENEDELDQMSFEQRVSDLRSRGINVVTIDRFFDYVYQQLTRGLFINHQSSTTEPYRSLSSGETALVGFDAIAEYNYVDQFNQFAQWVNSVDRPEIDELVTIGRTAIRTKMVVKDNCRPIAALIRMWYRELCGLKSTQINESGRLSRTVSVIDWQEHEDYYGITTKLIVKSTNNEILVWPMRQPYSSIFRHLINGGDNQFNLTFSVKSVGKYGPIDVTYITRGRVTF